MAQELANDEVTPLWRRHLTALRDDFSSASIQVAPSVPSAPRSADGREVSEDENVVNTWDEKIESVVEALDELILCVFPYLPEVAMYPGKDISH